MNLGGTIRLNKIGLTLLCALILLFVLYMSPRGEPTQSSIKINLRQLLQVAIDAAERGGKQVVSVVNEGNLKEESKGKTKEGVIAPVTNADYKSHCVMYYSITKHFPSVKVISEEKRVEKECESLESLDIEKIKVPHGFPDAEAEADQLTVWIDPLDATKEYTEKLYNYVTTMVCVAYKGNPIIGVIHKPFGAEPKTSWVWMKKFHPGQDTDMSPNLKNKKNVIDKKSVIISKSHPGSGIGNLVKNVFGETTEIIPAGGSGYKALEVAAGNVTAYVHSNYISKWDICAGDAIITGLGGSFTALNGNSIDYSASSPYSHKDGLLAIMDQHQVHEYIKLFQAHP